MYDKNKAHFEKVAVGKVIQSQMQMINSKKKNIASYKKLSKNVPKYDNVLKSDIVDHLLFLYLYMSSYLSCTRFSRMLLAYIPTKILFIYGVFYMYIHKKKSERDMRGLIWF